MAKDAHAWEREHLGGVTYPTKEEIARLRMPSITDTERLEWLMRNISGAEFRRLGVVYGGNCGRDRIDAAMRVPNAELRGAKPIGEASRSNDVLGSAAKEE